MFARAAFFSRRQLLLSGLALLSAAGFAVEAEACTMASGSSLRSVSRTLPSNGVVTMQGSCFTDCEGFVPPASPQVTDGDGNAVAGATVASGQIDEWFWLAWKPAEALVPGEQYQVAVTPPLFAGDATNPTSQMTLEVTEPMALEPASLEVTADVALVNTPVADERECCLDGPLFSCFPEPPCWTLETLAQPQFVLTAAEPTAQVGQFAYRVEWVDGEGPLSPTPWQIKAELTHVFEGPADEYCGAVSVLSLVDGSVHPLGTFCAAHEGLGVVGIVATPEERIDGPLSSCYVPPPAYHQRWCDLLDATFECPLDHQACSEALAACGPLSPASEAPAVAPTSDSAHTPPTLEAEGDNSASGCAVTLPPTERRGTAALALLLLALASGRWQLRHKSVRV